MARATLVGTPSLAAESKLVWERNRLKYVALKPQKAVGRPLTMLRQPAGNLRGIQIRTKAVNDRGVFRNDVVNRVTWNELALSINPKVRPLRYVLAEDFWPQDFR